VAGKFSSLAHYSQSSTAGFKLFPFRFIRLDSTRYVLSNEVGEYQVVTRDALSSIVNKTLLPTTQLYENLKAKHFIYDDDSSVGLDLLALKYRTKSSQVANFTSLHLFVVTLRCDHSCPYCQVSRQTQDRKKFDMTPEMAEKAVDFTFRSPSPNLKIEFQGGEPLLNFDLIKSVVLLAKARNAVEKRELQFVIATNLSQLNDEILAFCLSNDILLSTSLDGPEDLHNKNRPRSGSDSHQVTLKAITRAREVIGPDRVGALMTTTRDSLKRVTEIIDEYVRLGFSSIFLRPLSPYGFAVKTKQISSYGQDEWVEFYKEGLAYILDLNRRGVRFIEDYASIILTKMLTPFGGSYVDLQSPSGLGINVIVFNYDGDVYASDEGRMLAEMGNKQFRLGNLSENSYEQIMLSDALLSPLEESITESVPGCQDCGFQPYCGSDPVYHSATQGDLIGNKAMSGFCRRNMAIFRHLISLMEDDPQTAAILRSWVRY
jgi:uncharacterized protein